MRDTLSKTKDLWQDVAYICVQSMDLSDTEFSSFITLIRQNTSVPEQVIEILTKIRQDWKSNKEGIT